jgi:hypothetical protein
MDLDDPNLAFADASLALVASLKRIAVPDPPPDGPPYAFWRPH